MALRSYEGMRSAALLFGFGLVLAADPASSQPTQAQQNALRNNCRSDFMSNCSSVKPGGMEALQCLQRNAAKLSPACQSAVNALSPPSPAQHAAPAAAPAATPAAAPAATPAAAPAHTPPAHAAPAPTHHSTTAAHPPAAHPPASPPPTRQPTRTAKPAPAAAPAAAAPAQPTAQQQAALRQSCQSDFMSRCRGVQPGGADALRCLQRNSAQLSPACRSAVAAIGGGAPAAAATPAAAPAAAPAPQPDFVYQPMPPLLPRVQLGIIRACDGDRQAVCSMVPVGGGRVIDCLARNEPSLSPVCRQTLANARASAGR